MTILILFHFPSFRDLKHFHLLVRTQMKKDFPHSVSYNRFVELQRKVGVPLVFFLKMRDLDNAPVFLLSILPPFEAAISKEKSRIRPSRNLPEKVHWPGSMNSNCTWSSMTRENFPGFLLTPDNVDYRTPVKIMNFHKRIFGKLFADSGYISKDLFEQLFIDGVHLITRLKKRKKKALMLQYDKIMLRKRSPVETVNDQLKNICQIELDPPSMLPELHHQSIIGVGSFLLLRQKAFHQYCWGVCTSLFPVCRLGRAYVNEHYRWWCRCFRPLGCFSKVAL